MRSFILSALVAATWGTPLTIAQVRAPEEDIRVNMTRVFIEKAREVGRSTPTDQNIEGGFKAVESMVWSEQLPGESLPEQEARLNHIRNLANGFTALERSSINHNFAVIFQIKMGERERGEDDWVIVTFDYPEVDLASLPRNAPKGYMWQLFWGEVPDPVDPKTKRYRLRRVITKART